MIFQMLLEVWFSLFARLDRHARPDFPSESQNGH